MSYPPRLLSDGEHFVRQFRPHWFGIIKPLLYFDLLLALGIVVAVFTDLAWWIPVGIALVIGIIVNIGPIARHWFTNYVITNERLIVRSGVISKQGKEIPLEVITDVAFSQTVGERLFGAGDLLVESAGEYGQSRYSNVPRPEDVQALIYEQREARMMALQNTTDPTEQLQRLADLHRDGVVSDAEYEEKRRKLLGDI